MTTTPTPQIEKWPYGTTATIGSYLLSVLPTAFATRLPALVLLDEAAAGNAGHRLVHPSPAVGSLLLLAAKSL
jgi:hypothetical protein